MKNLNETTLAANKTLFNTVMENLKPFGMNDNQIIMASGKIPLSLCFVDSRYQGLRAHKKLNVLKKKWDIRKLTPIILVPHFEENRFAIVDGQGRYLVATDLGYDSLQAIVLMDAPKNVEERLKFEAEYFIGQDTETERVTSIEKHPARVIMGERAAVDLDRILTHYEVTFVDSKGQRQGNVLGSYPDAYKIMRKNGVSCMDFILSIIKNAGWNNEINGHGSFVIRSLSNAWSAYPERREEVHTLLSSKLREINPELFGSSARAKYPKREYRTACSLYVEDLICEGLNIPKKIYNAEA